MKTSVISSVLALSALMFPSCAWAQKVDNTPVDNLELQRYLGTWYEIARFDHSFERGMEFTKTFYSLNDDGMLRVENSGYKNGKEKMSIGKAFIPNPENEPALFRVAFFASFYSDYRVLMLSDDYQFALVGSGSPKYLWILSRSPYMPDSDIEAVLIEAKRRGYDTNDLKWVMQ